MRDPRNTPAMRQYAKFKQLHPECVLFFRMGDFYEMFDDDAVTCHKVLGLTLTQRTEKVTPHNTFIQSHCYGHCQGNSKL
jgi:DNA mismatch repair ATPase MutS